ncbi:MAG: hypothetical protein KKF68_02215 [Nanoarchaeota archaeon]|nr:hypothetical protein [Nanoarchaeota archaeon]
MEQNIQHLEPIITEEKLFNLNNLFLSFFIGITAIALIVVLILFLDLDRSDSILFSSLVIICYAIILFFLLEPSILRKVHTKEVQTIERPVEVIRTVERPVIRTVEKPVEVIRTVERPVIRKVFVEKQRKKLDIPRYEYRGSSQTKVYHKTSCRLSKSIKPKYKISKHSAEYFKRNKFKPCKMCLSKKKK